MRFTRTDGRAAPGERVVEAAAGYVGAQYTFLATLSLAGVRAPWIFEGALKGLALATYVEQQLSPSLPAGDVLILDNFIGAQKRLVACGYRSPWGAPGFLARLLARFDPIEKCWAKVKTALRPAKARTCDALIDVLATALRSVTPADAFAWFTHCGCATPSIRLEFALTTRATP